MLYEAVISASENITQALQDCCGVELGDIVKGRVRTFSSRHGIIKCHVFLGHTYIMGTFHKTPCAHNTMLAKMSHKHHVVGRVLEVTHLKRTNWVNSTLKKKILDSTFHREFL